MIRKYYFTTIKTSIRNSNIASVCRLQKVAWTCSINANHRIRYLGLLQTPYFNRIEFNSIQAGTKSIAPVIQTPNLFETNRNEFKSNCENVSGITICLIR